MLPQLITFLEQNDDEINRIISSWGKVNEHFDIKKGEVKSWFTNFKSVVDFSLALDIMSRIQYKSDDDTRKHIKSVVSELEVIFETDFENTFFFPLGNSSATSGSSYLYDFLKSSNNLSEANFKIDSYETYLDKECDIVFIDDIIGSGNQATKFYKKNLENSKANCYYVSLYGFVDGIEKIRENTNFKTVFTGYEIPNSLRAFHPDSQVFSDSNKVQIKELCSKFGERLFPHHALGYDDSQALIVFPNQVPNNTIPLIWASSNNEKKKGEINWYPLFERKKQNKKNDKEKPKSKLPIEIDRYLKDEVIKKFNTEFDNGKAYINVNAETRIYNEDIPKLSDVAISQGKQRKRFLSKPYQPIDGYVDTWINKHESNLLVILGEFGTGKTSLSRYIGYSLSNTILLGSKNKIVDKKQRIPIILYLRDFKENFREFVQRQLSIVYGLNDSYIDFRKKVNSNKYLVILDGFDEIPGVTKISTKQNKYGQLKELISDFPNSKFILTSRSELFHSTSKAIEFFEEVSKENVVFLTEFEDYQIQEYLKHKTNDFKSYWIELINNVGLKDLAQRPVLLDLIVKYLPEIALDAKTEINKSTLYEKCIKEELKRKASDVKVDLDYNCKKRT